jgi:hypothetical protein
MLTFFLYMVKIRAERKGLLNMADCFIQSEPGSSVSTVSGYGLDDRAIEVRSPAEAKGYSSLSVQTGSEAHPASCTMGTGDPFPGQSVAGA